MSVMLFKGFVGYEWEPNRRPRCGSVLNMVNTVNHLCRASLEPCQVLSRPTLGSASRVLSRSMYLPLLTD